MTHEVNVLVMVKGREKYIYVYDEVSLPELFEAFGRHAADPQMNLSWFDAGVLRRRSAEQIGAADFSV